MSAFEPSVLYITARRVTAIYRKNQSHQPEKSCSKSQRKIPRSTKDTNGLKRALTWHAGRVAECYCSNSRSAEVCRGREYARVDKSQQQAHAHVHDWKYQQWPTIFDIGLHIWTCFWRPILEQHRKKSKSTKQSSVYIQGASSPRRTTNLRDK